MNPESSKLPLQRETKPARLMDRVHFGATLLELRDQPPPPFTYSTLLGVTPL